MRLWAAVVLAACYSPPKDACGLTCIKDCPDGFTCSAQGTCQPTGGGACPVASLDFKAFGVGARHVCALDVGGALYCWGDNTTKQIGTGGMEPNDPAPVRVTTQTFTALSVGGLHTCAIAGGQVLCWGDDMFGEAIGGISGSPVPTPMAPAQTQMPPAFTQVAAGVRHTCALGSGQVWCWGATEELGNGQVAASYMVHVPGPDDFTELVAGQRHTCALSASMGVMCWGTNDRHQAVPGSFTNPIAMPTQVALPATPAHVFAGSETTCVVATTGALYCWGRNDQNVPFSLPNGAAGNDLITPTQIGTDTTWTSYSGNDRTACGIRGGMAICWGSEDTGELGDGLWFVSRDELAARTPLAPADSIVTAMPSDSGSRDEVTCFLAGTKLSCFGADSNGNLGIGIASRHPTPVEIPPPQNGLVWKTFITGRNHACATTSDGAAWCWGEDSQGAVRAGVARGDNTPCIPGQPCDAPLPERAPITGNPDELIAGEGYTCARIGSAVSCWGHNDRNTLGPNAQGDAVVPVPGTFMRLFGGDRASCGLDASMTLQCWGNVAGQGGATPAPLADSSLTAPRDVRFGDDFGCLTRDTDNSRICWGDNSAGELGDGTNNSQQTPGPQETGNVQIVVAMQRHTCEIAGGNVFCVGDNNNGVCGQPNGGQFNTMMAVKDQSGTQLANCTALSSGDSEACAICNGTPMCWGNNQNGELGRGTTGNSDQSAAPVALPPGHNWVHVATGWSRSCALDDAGHLFCWGDGPHGEHGDGSHASNLPTVVAP